VGIAIGIVLVLLYLAANLFLRSAWVDGIIRRDLARLLSEATQDSYAMTIGDLEIPFGLRSIRAENLVIVPTRPRPDLAVFTERVSAGHVGFEGLRWLPLLRGDVIFDAIRLHGPSIAFTVQPQNRQDSLSVERTSETLPSSPLRVRDLTVVDGAFQVIVAGSSPDTTIIRGIDVALTNLSTESSFMLTPQQLLEQETLTGSIDSVHFSNGPYVLDATDIHLSNRDAAARVDRVQYGPRVGDSLFFAGLEFRQDRIRVDIRGIALRGTAFSRFVNDFALDVDLVLIDSLAVDVFSDKRIPSEPGPRPRLIEDIEEFDAQLALDSIAVRSGWIKYSEFEEGAARPGTLQFTDVNGWMRNLSNDPVRMTPQTPLVIQMNARLQDTASVSARMSVPIVSEEVGFTLSGAVGPTEASAVINDMTVPLQGVAIVAGTLDSAWFAATAVAGEMTGELHAAYRDLTVELVSKQTERTNLLRSLGGAAANLFVVRTNNPSRPGREPERGEISYTVTDSDTIFAFLWKGLRSGITSLVSKI
jgi:hypothetical protein